MIRRATGATGGRTDRGASTGPIGIVRACTDRRAKRPLERDSLASLVKEVHSEGLDDERPPPETQPAGPLQSKIARLQSGGRESNASGGTVARRTNYGFEKKQRELRKQKKNQEKAERRRREEAPSSAPKSGEAADKTPPESEPPDRG